MTRGTRSFRIPLLSGTPGGKLLADSARAGGRRHHRSSERTAILSIDPIGTRPAKIEEKRSGFLNRSTERLGQTLAFRLTVACLRRISHWRVPPNWSHRDWSCEIRAQSAAAAWQATCEYDASRGVPFGPFVRERVMEAALLRYRKEWRYVTRCSAVPGGPKREPRIEVVASDLIASLRKAVNLLPPAEKRLIGDLFWQERTEASVAERSGVSQQAVSKQKKAILRHLRRALTPPSFVNH